MLQTGQGLFRRPGVPPGCRRTPPQAILYRAFGTQEQMLGERVNKRLNPTRERLESTSSLAR
jgi:hypothetical protein